MAFRNDDYDCVGFDLDFTLVQYKVPALVQLEYTLLAEYLVTVKGYSSQHLLQPLNDMDIEFMQKGLFIDFERGNIVKLAPGGAVCRASHGTKFLNSDEVTSLYGPNKVWDCGRLYWEDPLQAWNGPLGERIRPVLDYYDTPSLLVFARSVDSGAPVHQIWPDIVECFYHIFERTQFSSGEGGFFSELKAHPDKYYYKTDPKIISWLKELKGQKFTYLISGSYIDFIGLTAGFGLGCDWQQYFDVIISYAKKPAFFYEARPYCNLVGDQEVGHTALTKRGVYSQGNWSELYELIKEATKLDQPRCLYIGDNIVQDVVTPATRTSCKTAAISAEKGDFNIIKSSLWGDYFSGFPGGPSLWSEMIRMHATHQAADIGSLLTL